VFCGKVWAAVEHTPDGTTKAAAKLIEARDNAVRLALLEELSQRQADLEALGFGRLDAVSGAFARLLSKYSPKGEP
jgi:hypothetical protein